MGIIKAITDAITKEGHVSKLADTFDELELELPVGIKMHYAGIDGIDEDRLVIRTHNNDTTGDVIMKVEYEGVYDEWVLSKPYSAEQIAVIDGKENYTEIAHAIKTYMDENVRPA